MVATPTQMQWRLSAGSWSTARLSLQEERLAEEPRLQPRRSLLPAEVGTPAAAG